MRLTGRVTGRSRPEHETRLADALAFFIGQETATMAFRITAATSIPRGSAGRVAIPRWLFASPIWLQASPEAKVCFVQIASRYDGENNGKIEFGIRDTRLSRSRASEAFEELQELQLAINVNDGRNKVATWRLPHLHCNVTGAAAVKNWSREWEWTEREIVAALQASHYLAEQYVDPGKDWYSGMPTRGDLWYARDHIIFEGIHDGYNLTDAQKSALIEISEGNGVFEPWMLRHADFSLSDPPKGFFARVREARHRDNLAEQIGIAA
jgi:hypothetical protein